MSVKIDGVNRFRGFEPVSYAPKDIEMPKRKTKFSAAYDFVLPETVTVGAKCFSKMIPLYVKCYMQKDECLELFIRSSIATKKHCWLPTSVSVVDSDYYNCEENEGNIFIVIYNADDEPHTFESGERIVQGKFSQYLVVDNDNADEERKGGAGSTGR